jgi:hypothetical protein
VFRKNGGMFDLVERLDRGGREIAEKTAGTQMAIDTAFDAVQARHGYHFSISKGEFCIGRASTGDSFVYGTFPAKTARSQVN